MLYTNLKHPDADASVPACPNLTPDRAPARPRAPLTRPGRGAQALTRAAWPRQDSVPLPIWPLRQTATFRFLSGHYRYVSEIFQVQICAHWQMAEAIGAYGPKPALMGPSPLGRLWI